MIANLVQLFTAAKVARAIESAPPIHSTVQDAFFPETARQQYDLPLIPLSELRTVINCVPMVSRSGESVPLDGESFSSQYVEPLPVRLRGAVVAMELNNLKLLDLGQQQEWANRKILNNRTAIKKTIEVLCAQAVFDGEINYPLLRDNGTYDRYKVSYGDAILTRAVDGDDKWDAANASLAKVFLLLQNMDTDIDEAGYGGDKETWAGKLAYAQLLVLVETANQAKAAKVPSKLMDDGSVNVGGIIVRKMAETWKDPETGASNKKIADNEIRMVSKGNQAFFYAALDDFQAKLRAMPMLAYPVEIKDPSEIRLLATSKPLPAVAPRATCRAVVLT